LGQCNGRERFSAREFWRIEKLVKEKVGIREIARLMDRSPSSVLRQANNPSNMDWFVDRKKYVIRFSAAKAIEHQNKKRKGRGRIPKVAKDFKLRQFLEEAIKKRRWSPQIAVGVAQKQGWKFKERVSVKTVYNSIYRNDLDISLFDLLLKLRRKPSKDRIKRLWKRIFGKRIDERPDISDRKEFGHWEIDTILWGRECSVLVLIERKTRYCKLFKLAEHTAQEVNEKLITLNPPLKSLTADNGHEFAHLLQLFENTYFTHPYSAWEKGSVENLNSLIRQFLPRTTNPDRISQSRLDEIENLLNTRPRPILNYSTPKELYDLETA
jgi:IS30 family transposase